MIGLVKHIQMRKRLERTKMIDLTKEQKIANTVLQSFLKAKSTPKEIRESMTDEQHTLNVINTLMSGIPITEVFVKRDSHGEKLEKLFDVVKKLMSKSGGKNTIYLAGGDEDAILADALVRYLTFTGIDPSAITSDLLDVMDMSDWVRGGNRFPENPVLGRSYFTKLNSDSSLTVIKDFSSHQPIEEMFTHDRYWQLKKFIKRKVTSESITILVGDCKAGKLIDCWDRQFVDYLSRRIVVVDLNNRKLQ